MHKNQKLWHSPNFGLMYPIKRVNSTHCEKQVVQDAQEDSKLRAQMSKELNEKVRDVRKQINEQKGRVSDAEAKQLKALDSYALGVQTALNRKGKLPFDYAWIEASEALDDVAASLEKLEKKGDH